jgi:hypothetical protein
MGFGLIIQRRSHAPAGEVTGINRNAQPEWIGISGLHAPEYAGNLYYESTIPFHFLFR